MNTKCHSESVKRKYLLNFVTHIFWHYTVFVSLGNCPHPRSEEVLRLLSSPEFKKPLSLLGVARIFGEAVRLWFESMVYVLEIEWPLQLSFGEDEVVLHPPLPPHVHEHKMGHLDFRYFFFKSKQYSRPASAAMICSSTNVKAFTSASLKLVILVSAEKRSEFCKRTTNRPT